MLLGFKTELKLNNQQRTVLARHAGTARHAYNWGLALTKAILDHNKNNQSEKIKFPTAIDLHKGLNRLVKPENQWYYQSSKCAPQYALKALVEAWKRCFKKRAGVPRFKKKGKRDSFTLDGSIKVLGNNRIKIPVIGVLRTYERLPQVDVIKSVTISRQADSWFISFKIETDELTNHNSAVVGIDLGVKSLAVLSTGEVIEGAKSYRQAEKRLAKLQRQVSRKNQGSNNRAKSIIKLAKAHARVANIRKDTLHKLTSYLSKNHAVVGIENLNVSGMLANRKLAKAISDMGFYEFRRQLEYKCKLYGSQLIIAWRFFASSKTCSNCGCVKESLSLAERTFNCSECNFSIDRDLNAAINLEKYAASSVVSACGRGAADSLG